jgi:hypothetical protein
VTVGGSPVSATYGTSGWLAAATLVVYPLLKYGVAFRVPLSVLTLLAVVAAYVLVIYLIRSISGAVYYGGLWPILAAGAVALVAGWMVCHPSQRFMMVCEMVMITGTGAVVGTRVRAGDSGSRVYLYGTLVVIAGGIAMYAAQWGQLMAIFASAGKEAVDSVTQNLTAFGYHPEAAKAYAGQMNSIVEVMARLVPSATIINMVAQFSIGFVWFLSRGVSAERSAVLLAPLTRWRVPFGLIALVIAAALGRLLGGELVVLIADNLFLGLSVCYCVGGLALAAHVLIRLNLPLVVRVLFYIAMLLTGVIGYMLIVLLGFVDSFADWRKLSSQSIELDKS